MQSTVQLFNIALARLGGEQLDSRISPQEPDALGRLCQNLFSHVLDISLAAHAWSFARASAALARLAPRDGAFALPADCLRPLRLEDGQAFQIQGQSLVCSCPCPVLVYVRRVTEPKLWPASFADALAWGLAAELASAKNNDNRKQQWAMQNYELSLSRAIARDCAKNSQARPLSPWACARFGRLSQEAR